jgi:phenylacetate-coenzyme A ligase PaaK-like adenylate-forming protein
MRPNLADYPFYRARLGSGGQPTPWSLGDLEEFAGAHPGDPFAGRVLPGAKPMVALQIEATGEPAVWTGLDSGELDQWAGVLTRIWRRWGCSAGEAIAFFDYGSSPLVLLASGGYIGYLRRGAAERLGLTAICNDGVASMAARMVTILETVKPSMLILRRDLAAPLISALEAAATAPIARLRWVALSEPEGVARRADAERAAASFGLPVYRILRCDGAFLLAGECSHCGLFHLDRLYRAQALASGEVAVTARFARLCPAVRYNIGPAKLVAPGCPLEPRAHRIECSQP